MSDYQDKLDPVLKDAVLKSRGKVKVIAMLNRKLKRADMRTLKDICNRVEDLGIINALAIEVKIANLNKLAQMEFIDKLLLDEVITYIE